MLPTNFEQSNKCYTKPEGWTDEQCMDLNTWEGNVIIDDIGSTAPAIISCWKLSYEDLQEIQKTGVIWLAITGSGMPPVSLFTENPFKQ